MITGLLGEWYLRGQVPRCGITPFRESDLPGVAHELRPSFETLYKGHTVQTNPQGFRAPDFQNLPPDAMRLALIGDSVTFGNAISYDDTMAVQLEGILRNEVPEIRVLNCGVPGYNAPNVLECFQHRVLPLQPDYVVYVFVSNDITPSRGKVAIPQDQSIDSFHGFPLGSAVLQWLGVTVKGVLRAVGRGSASGTIAQIQNYFHDGGRERLEQAIAGMQSLCKEKNIPFAVATYPFLTTPNPYEEIDQWVLDFCSEQSIPAINLREAFADEQALPQYWANIFDPHPSGPANAIACEYLANGLLPSLVRDVPGK